MGPYCKFCNQRCFVHMPMTTPKHILKAYGTSTIIATCSGGQKFEKDKVGYCYDDIKAIAELGNGETLASLDKAMSESMDGQTINRGSFAKYVEEVNGV